MIEFVLVLSREFQSRGFTNKERMEKYSLLIHDFSNILNKSYPVTPLILLEKRRLEEVYELDYFDAGISATSFPIDGKIAINDKQLNRITEIESLWEEILDS